MHPEPAGHRDGKRCCGVDPEVVHPGVERDIADAPTWEEEDEEDADADADEDEDGVDADEEGNEEVVEEKDEVDEEGDK